MSHTRHIIRWGTVILWAVFIFYLSSIPELESGLRYDFPLRKIAHVTEYFVLTRLLVWALEPKDKTQPASRILLAALLAFLYAVSDEYHQTFVGGREGHLRDIVIDSLGILVVVVVAQRHRNSSGSIKKGSRSPTRAASGKNG